MEDRKRSMVPEHDELAPPAKRQAMSNNANGTKTHPDADLPWKEDLENFQKDAILRQLREYKREKQTCESQIAEMEKKMTYHDDHLRVVDSWFNQLLDEIRLMVNDIVVTRPLQPNDALFPPSLLFSDSEKFQEHLSDRSQKIRSVLSDLLSKSPGDANAEKLQEQLSKLLAQEKVTISELHRVTTEKDQLIERLEKASYRYMVAEKKLDRAKSQAVAKIERQAMQGATAAQSHEEPKDVKKESTEVNGTTVQAPVSEELLSAKKEAEAIALKRKEQLDKLDAENQKLTAELTQLKVRLSGLSDEDYSKTELFKGMKSQYDEVIRRINDLTAVNNTLREEAQKLQQERTQYRIQVDEETRVSIQNSETQLSKAETDLSRIRNSRDEYLADVTIRKAAAEEHKTSFGQIQDLAKASDDRIKALELEVERLKVQIGEQQASGERADLEQMDADQLRGKIVNLEKEYALVLEEMPSLEVAYKKAQAIASKKTAELVAWEEQIARLNAEKAKADQKFFGAMKAKEAREQESRLLRAQNLKSAEIITQLKEAETSSRNLAVNLEKQLTETKEAVNSTTSQVRTTQATMTKHLSVAEGFVSQIAELKKVVSSKDATCTAACQAQREAEVKIEQLQIQVDDSNKQIEEWKARSQGKQTDTEGQLRQMVLCTICRRNWKNTCIKLCGHVFCQECVDERVQSRSRKCPGCGKSFGANDTMRVHLT
ncbi:E3 ubiquitin-protein ligase-like protein bre1 [Pseudovirgaria hyperparasitica]|uniref:E3 ubiquitin protein ligase n=1 Tax=Pseudovirgaria hyperparasitica TaxID=470096 RepID=A0A6A6W1S6_9PEZI|nr:E3 ubiquitin-protein ligase-like protein bre1 [Pseudovirgaria hyperparasitica]KAF2756026.1 E3 ubiquitin-protein ligase-like protein bre1 [Pseudovirgaria hyperparasitica]